MGAWVSMPRFYGSYTWITRLGIHGGGTVFRGERVDLNIPIMVHTAGRDLYTCSTRRVEGRIPVEKLLSLPSWVRYVCSGTRGTVDSRAVLGETLRIE